MRHQIISRARYGLAVVLVGLLLLTGVSAPITRVAARQGGNLLLNPGFEQPYVAVGGDTTMRVATNWQPWYLPPGSASSVNAQPEYKPAPDTRIRSGLAAQEYNTFFATHTAGVYQRVAVSPGSKLRFAVWVYVWSSATFENPDVSEDPNDVVINVGIDPAGGTDATSPNIVWSDDAEYYDQYREMSVTATATGTAVTVFVRTAPTGFVGISAVYLDDASLIALAQGQPTPTNQPGRPTNTPTGGGAPVPTQEGTATPLPASPTPLASPTPAPSATLPPEYTSTVYHTVQSGDTVWGLARRYNSTVALIIQVNGLNSNGFISVGQVLTIPIRNQYPQPPTFTPAPTSVFPTVPPPTAFPPTLVPGGYGTYTVQRGDTLYALARRFNTTVATLAQLNNIVNANLIYPGQVLRVPGAAPIPVTATPVAPAPTAPPAQPTTHVVQAGENLYRIALSYGVTWDAIARANGLWNPNLIYAGQVLVIPR